MEIITRLQNFGFIEFCEFFNILHEHSLGYYNNKKDKSIQMTFSGDKAISLNHLKLKDYY